MMFDPLFRASALDIVERGAAPGDLVVASIVCFLLVSEFAIRAASDLCLSFVVGPISFLHRVARDLRASARALFLFLSISRIVYPACS